MVYAGVPVMQWGRVSLPDAEECVCAVSLVCVGREVGWGGGGGVNIMQLCMCTVFWKCEVWLGMHFMSLLNCLLVTGSSEFIPAHDVIAAGLSVNYVCQC